MGRKTTPFAVTQSPVKDHQLTLMWKTLMSKNNDNYNKRRERLITTTRSYTDNTRTNRTIIIRKKPQLYGHFNQLIRNISHEKTWTWLRKRNLKRETESLLIAAQNNAMSKRE